MSEEKKNNKKDIQPEKKETKKEEKKKKDKHLDKLNEAYNMISELEDKLLREKAKLICKWLSHKKQEEY